MKKPAFPPTSQTTEINKWESINLVYKLYLSLIYCDTILSFSHMNLMRKKKANIGR